MNPLADMRLNDSEGAEVRLGDLWAERAVALIFLHVESREGDVALSER